MHLLEAYVIHPTATMKVIMNQKNEKIKKHYKTRYFDTPESSLTRINTTRNKNK